MNRRFFILTALMAVFGVSVANAEIDIRIGDAGVPAGGTGSLDVYLTPAVNTNLTAFAFELAIDTPYGVDSLLQFVEPRPAYENDSDYVFFGATSAGPLGDTVGSSPTTQWVGSDLADVAPLGYVELTGGTSYLLARLDLQHSSLPPPYDPNGQSFEVSLVTGANTYFWDDTLTDIPLATVTAGTVTIPEPSSLLIIAGLAICAAPCLRRRPQ